MSAPGKSRGKRSRPACCSCLLWLLLLLVGFYGGIRATVYTTRRGPFWARRALRVVAPNSAKLEVRPAKPKPAPQ